MDLKRLPRFARRTTIAAALLICAACGKEEHKKRFDWVRAGSRLYYDAYGPTDTIRDFRCLLVFADDKFLRIQEEALGGGSSYSLLLYDVTQRRYQVKRGGLHSQACGSCGGLIVSCGSSFDYLFAPNAPFLYQALPYYSCSSEPEGTNYVVNTDTVVTVPLGTFHAYALRHPNGDRSYWNPREGLIMYKVHYRHRTIWHGALRLNRIER